MGTGARPWVTVCDVCGQQYRYTNFEMRQARKGDGTVVTATRHKAKCRGWSLDN